MRGFFAPILSSFYGLAISIRHAMFDWGWHHSLEYDIPIVCVGNLTVGGTGKTPVCEFLIEQLGRQYNIALLSRGYGRRTKGYLEVQTNSPFRDTGDEPKQIKLKYPGTVVAVCEDRREGIAEIRRRHPETNLILMDDGFQHRWVEPWANIILMDYNRPIYNDHLLPWGSLRDKPSQLYRANFIIITKCPSDLTPLEARIVKKSLRLYPYQSIYFTWFKSSDTIALFSDTTPQKLARGSKVIAMAGIGNPGPFVEQLGKDYDVAGELIFKDHHPYRMIDLERMREALAAAGPDAYIVTTEKDAVKLTNRKRIPDDIANKLYYISVNIKFAEGHESSFTRKLREYVRTNQKHSLLHS